MSTPTRAKDGLRYLAETEARGCIIYRGTVRWRIAGFCERRPQRAVYAINRTGQLGNRFVILERVDEGTPQQPTGYRKVVSKQTFPPVGYMLEEQGPPTAGETPA